MFFFGHVGVTLGAAVLANGLVRAASGHHIGNTGADPQEKSAEIETKRNRAFPVTDWFASLGRFLDIRLLLIGSMLPDIIDKPLGYFLKFGNGRSITHTLLVTLLFLIAALFLYIYRRQTWLLALAIGMVAHLILDFMWQTPETFYWPVYHWWFAPQVDQNWIGHWLEGLATNRMDEAFEAAGFLVVLVFTWTILRQRQIMLFLSSGRLRHDDS